MPRKIDAGEVLAALGGALVLVALSLSWFDGSSGWEAFESVDLVLAGLALVAVAAAVASIAGSPSGPSPRALPWVGTLLLVVVAVQLIEPPPLFAGGDPRRETGAWLALAGAALVLLGAILRLARISVTISVGGRDVRKRVPAVDRRPSATPATAPPAPADGDAAAAVGHAPSSDPQATQPFRPVEEP